MKDPKRENIGKVGINRLLVQIFSKYLYPLLSSVRLPSHSWNFSTMENYHLLKYFLHK